jgi:7,8-dihydropterin-6-yl-methyl-4-(beta-D-ribofuranosyl)aminobenzene 5'-phosphate synthase
MLRIVTLIENTPGERKDLVHEHGLSFYIERSGDSLVFDTGAGSGFLYNAAKLRINTQAVKALVISHAHYDHAGGVRSFYENNSTTIPLVTGENFFDPKYKKHDWGRDYIGIDFDAHWLREKGICHQPLCGTSASFVKREIIPGVWAAGGFPRIFPLEIDNPFFVVEREGRGEVDDFRDEICIIVEDSNRLIVIAACSHPGIMNMLESIRKTFNKRIGILIGGIHLLEASSRRIESFFDYAASLDCDCFGLAHCSGNAVRTRMEKDAKRFYRASTGSSLYV